MCDILSGNIDLTESAVKLLNPLFQRNQRHMINRYAFRRGKFRDIFKFGEKGRR